MKTSTSNEAILKVLLHNQKELHEGYKEMSAELREFRKEMTGFRHEITTDMEDLRQEVADFRTEMKTEFSQLDERLEVVAITAMKTQEIIKRQAPGLHASRRAYKR